MTASEDRDVSLTAVHDIVLVTIIQRAPNLSCKLSRDTLTEPPMTDNIVQHLAPVDILEDHVVMVLVDDHFPHPTDVWMV